MAVSQSDPATSSSPSEPEEVIAEDFILEEVTFDDLPATETAPAIVSAAPVTANPTQAIALKATSFVDQLNAHKIVDDATFLACNDLFRTAAIMLDEIDATFDPIISAANKAHKTALAQKAQHYKPVADALAAAKGRFLTEKARRDQEAERQRIASEATVRQEIEQAATDIADELSAEGRFEEAEQVIEQAKHTDVGAIAPRSTVVNTLANVGTSGRWKVLEADINLLELVKAIAAGKAPLSCVLPNMTDLNKRASADKAALKIPGVTPKFVPNVSVRR